MKAKIEAIARVLAKSQGLNPDKNCRASIPSAQPMPYWKLFRGTASKILKALEALP